MQLASYSRPWPPLGRALSLAWRLALFALLLVLAPAVGRAQQGDTALLVPPMATVALDSVAVAPSAIDTKGESIKNCGAVGLSGRRQELHWQWPKVA